ncbi:SDR family NAD(P)-dependent oxidoreductase [Mycolicibacterium mageritense]|uniref:3-oxoacyl-[acyl-carrier-protein] reductase FabG n=1 Tax=Mycolicibacterium mageritense TaxID=53462 RepID=A0AAI8XLC8_MYCME|nr:SDR family oxidoreductase [Mycolicibacterium mageritense]BDY26695.1 3-oxoacyl-[acyl-carrier-protein] reductase FabG [Mycolicibacterium mageritense]
MRSVLVTGASSGVGRATARAFAECGDIVAVHYSTNRCGAEQTLSSLAGGGHTIVCGDIGNPTEARRIVDEAAAELGALDVLVNNAAVAPTHELRHPIADVAYDSWCAVWERMIGVNLLGAGNVAWAAVQHMINRGGGRIVNVGSRGAFRGEPEYPAYGASKAALHALGQSLAVALAPYNIGVTSVAPGFIASERQEVRLRGEDGMALRHQSPFDRVGTPDEVASAIVYLASPQAEWASGAILDLNGASYLRT